MSYSIQRSHEIHAGHRVVGHEGKCRHLHGHSYVFDVECAPIRDQQALDQLGRVIDFSVIKETICAWLDETWDHRLLIWEQDPLLRKIMAIGEEAGIVTVPFNPTAENLARHIVDVVGPSLLQGTGVQVIQCTVQETIKCRATYLLSAYD